ncbi:MAG: hypothetical protein HRT38_13070 [Alteromonadaceae bacterium]|nr:hypothetical protein [Alteromonadaceae bacterium]
MNQSILFNDDIYFDEKKSAWFFTGFLDGAPVTVQIKEKYHQRGLVITDSVKFDWEDVVENWLEDHEPNEDRVIVLNFD